MLSKGVCVTSYGMWEDSAVVEGIQTINKLSIAKKTWNIELAIVSFVAGEKAKACALQ